MTYELQVSSAIKDLQEYGLGNSFKVEKYESRVFSELFRLISDKSDNQSYILKVSKTDRRASDEYDAYKCIAGLGIETLEPIVFNDKLNYVVTIEKELMALDTYLRLHPELESEMMVKIGTMLSQLNIDGGKKTVKLGTFDNERYILPRLEKTRLFSPTKKAHLAGKIKQMLASASSLKVRESLFSDLTFFNINVASDRRLVLLDLGDMHKGCFEENLIYVYLQIKYSYLGQYYSSASALSTLFDTLKNTTNAMPTKEVENIYLIRHLLNMILFIESLEPKGNTINKVLSKCSNELLKLRYKRQFEEVVRKG